MYVAVRNKSGQKMLKSETYVAKENIDLFRRKIKGNIQSEKAHSNKLSVNSRKEKVEEKN